MNGTERRVIQASIFAGLTEMALGLVMVLTGTADWYFETFHFFGILGFGLVMYGVYTWILARKDTGDSPWQKQI